MKREASISMFQYWNRLRHGRTAPRRTEIEPADIKSLLGDTFILETDARGEATFRLAGTRLCAIYGRELKATSFGGLWRDADRGLMSRLIGSVFKDHGVLVATYEGISRTLRRVPLELLVLPLDSGNHQHRALGIVSAESKPYWLGADSVVDASLSTVRIVNPDRDPLFLKNRPAIAIPERSAFDFPSRIGDLGRDGARRIRHLLVLPGGRP